MSLRTHSHLRSSARHCRRLVHEFLEPRHLFSAAPPAAPPVSVDVTLDPPALSILPTIVPGFPGFVGMPTSGDNSQPFVASFERFSSADELKQYLIQDALQRYESLFGTEHRGYPHYWGDGYLCLTGFDGSLAASANSAVTLDYSQTNVQVSGVDEADLMETDGNYLYLLSGKKLTIVDARPGEETGIVSQVNLEGRLMGEYLAGDRLAVLWQPSQTDGVGWHSQRQRVSVFDVSDRRAPRLVQQTDLDGDYVGSRVIDNHLYIVLRQRGGLRLPAPQVLPIAGPWPSAESDARYGDRCCVPVVDGVYETKEEYLARVEADWERLVLPQLEAADGDGQVVRSGRLVEPTDIYRPLCDAGSLISVVTFDLAGSQPGPIASVAVPSRYGTQLYVSADNLYLLNTTYASGEEETSVEQFHFDADGSVQRVAAGVVPGSILNSFSVDEYEGYLRIATVRGPMRQWSNNIYVLRQEDQELSIVGRLENLAPGERIYSARYLGDKAYLVTFRMTDPLFGIDLSDPAQPSVSGELVLPGFSSYLQMIDGGCLIGIGRNADPATGRFQDPQISLFDVNDLSQPQLLHRFTIDVGRNGSVPAETDPHAIGYFPQEHILTVPVSRFDCGGTQSELWVFKVDVSKDESDEQHGELRLLTRLSRTSSPWSRASELRSAQIGDELFVFSPDTLTVHPLADPTVELKRIDLTQPPPVPALTDGPLPPIAVDPPTPPSLVVEPSQPPPAPPEPPAVPAPPADPFVPPSAPIDPAAPCLVRPADENQVSGDAVTSHLADVKDGPMAKKDLYHLGERRTLRVASSPSGVLANDSDQDSVPLAATLVSGPSHGRLKFKSDGTFVYRPDQGFFGADSFTYKAGDGQLDSAPCTVTIQVEGSTPRVHSVVVNGGAAQRSMVTSLRVTFDRTVTIDPGAFLVSRLGDGLPVGLNVVVRVQGGRTVARLTFTGPDLVGGSLADGNYQLTILADKVHRGATSLDGDHNGSPGGDFTFGERAKDAFFRLFGDSDGDRDVDPLDRQRFRLSYYHGFPRYRSRFDFDGDGDLDTTDLLAFRQNYGKKLPRP